MSGPAVWLDFSYVSGGTYLQQPSGYRLKVSASSLNSAEIVHAPAESRRTIPLRSRTSAMCRLNALAGEFGIPNGYKDCSTFTSDDGPSADD